MKRETERTKVELPDGTKFQMPTYGTGYNEEYLANVIAILHLVKQKGTAAEVKEAFAKQKAHTANSHGLSQQFMQMELIGFNVEHIRKNLISGE
jgi:hypothetical protein